MESNPNRVTKVGGRPALVIALNTSADPVERRSQAVMLSVVYLDTKDPPAETLNAEVKRAGKKVPEREVPHRKR